MEKSLDSPPVWKTFNRDLCPYLLPVVFPTSAQRGKSCSSCTISRKFFCPAFFCGECWALSCHPLEPALGLLGYLAAPTEPVHGWVMWGPACGRGCSHVRPPGHLSFHSGNPNIAPCDQVLAKKWSNPYLGQVQGLKFLTASFPGSAACAALKALGESRSLLLMV